MALTVKELKKSLEGFDEDLPVYKLVNTNFDFYDPDDHTLEEISPFIKRVYFDKDENDFRIANRPNKKTANAEKAVII